MDAAHISVIVLIVVMILYITEIIPIAVTAMGSCAALVVLSVTSSSTVWVGLSSDTTLVVGGMMAVGTALIETGVANDLGDFIYSKFKGNVEISAYLIIIISIILSAFMNNSATIATMLPVLAGIVVSSRGKLHEKSLFLPLAVATNAGGMLTLIGTTAQMIAQETLIQNGLKPFGFFEFAYVGLPVCIMFSLYMVTVGKWLNKKIFPYSEEHSEYVNNITESGESKGKTHNNSSYSSEKRKKIMSVLILVFCIIWMTLNTGVSNGTIALIGCGLCILTGCISMKTLYRKLDWTTLFVLAGGIGFAKGLDACGGGELIANYVLNLFGNNISATTVYVMLTVTAGFLTLFMSNTAVAAMLSPIALAFSSKLGISIFPLLMGICMGSNCSFSTPIATPSMTMVLGPGEYKFVDYIKWALPLNILCIVVIIIIIPQIWPL